MARKNVTKTAGATAAQEPAGTESVETEEETSTEATDTDDEVLTPLPVKATPAPSKRPRRNLAGVYTCKTCVRQAGVKHNPGDELTLTDEEARHYLKLEAVTPLD